MITRLIGGLVLGLAWVGCVDADQPAHRPFWQRWWDLAPACPTPCCPNNFDRKPMPCVANPYCTSRDDYCRKPLPCVANPYCVSRDDYCRKSLPCVMCSPLSALFSCGPPPCGVCR